MIEQLSAAPRVSEVLFEALLRRCLVDLSGRFFLADDYQWHRAFAGVDKAGTEPAGPDGAVPEPTEPHAAAPEDGEAGSAAPTPDGFAREGSGPGGAVEDS